jgi:hypothetical protein
VRMAVKREVRESCVRICPPGLKLTEKSDKIEEAYASRQQRVGRQCAEESKFVAANAPACPTIRSHDG